MNFENYRKEVARAEMSPDFQQRVLQKLEATQQERKNERIVKTTRRSMRVALIAAAVAVMFCISAAAIAVIITAQHKALVDLGMNEDGTVNEYTAYADENAPANADGSVTLVSTVCTGANMDAFFLVSPIPERAALSVQNEDGRYYWSIGVIDTMRKTATILVSQVDYDTETNAALVRVTLTSEALTELSSINIPLVLTSGEENISFGGVNVPVTESRLLTGAAEIDLSCGKVTGVTIGATFIEVSIEAPPIGNTSNLDTLHEVSQDRRSALAAVLKDASVQLADGTSIAVSELRSPYASEWVLSDGDLSAMEAGSFRMEHLCSTVLDTAQIVSITIGNTVIPVK